MTNNVWQQAIDEELICSFLGVAKDDATLEEATKALHELIMWHIEVATNPKTNGGYALVHVDHILDSGFDIDL